VQRAVEIESHSRDDDTVVRGLHRPTAVRHRNSGAKPRVTVGGRLKRDIAETLAVEFKMSL
jgi:hypothetical protein